MRLIRRFEDTVQELLQRGEVHATTHLYSGMEAGAVGTYRGHGHAIAVCVEPAAGQRA